MTSLSAWQLMLQITVWEQYCFRSLMDWNIRSATSVASSGQLNSTTPQSRKKRWLWWLPSAPFPSTLDRLWSRSTRTILLFNTFKRCRIRIGNSADGHLNCNSSPLTFSMAPGKTISFPICLVSLPRLFPYSVVVQRNFAVVFTYKYELDDVK